MDFSFNVNELLREEIIQVDNRLQPCRQNGVDRQGFQQLQKQLYEIVDKMGDASAKAQGLHGSITTGKKLEMAEHRLYIMKDGSDNRGHGSVLGILKVGTKKLFVYDHSKIQHELEPLCILDFYVHESRQRMGCGRKLFDFMLRNEGMLPHHLAIDRPSPKFLSFLAKHYKLRATIPQVNNFVIFEGFFHDRTDMGNNRSRRRPPGENSGYKVNSRSSPLRPNSGQRNSQVHKYDSNPSHSHLSGSTKQPGEEHAFQNVMNNWVVPGISRQQPSHMGAGEMMYSRHRATPPKGFRSNSPAPSRGPQPQETVSANIYYKKLNGLASPHTYYNTGLGYNPYFNSLLPSNSSQRPVVYPDAAVTTPRGVASTPNFGNRTNGADMSQIIPQQQQQPNPGSITSTTVLDPRYPSHASQAPPPAIQLPSIPTNQQAGQSSVNSLAQRPPSGKQNTRNNRDTTNPPVLQRDGPPANYKDMLNMHQNYQGRNGHLAVSPGTNTMALNGQSPSRPSPAPYNASAYPSPVGNWTVTGVLREQHMAGPSSNKYYYSSNRIW